MKTLRRLATLAAVDALGAAAEAARTLADAHRTAATEARTTATRFDRAAFLCQMMAVRLLLGPPRPVTPPPPEAGS